MAYFWAAPSFLNSWETFYRTFPMSYLTRSLSFNMMNFLPVLADSSTLLLSTMIPTVKKPLPAATVPVGASYSLESSSSNWTYFLLASFAYSWSCLILRVPSLIRICEYVSSHSLASCSSLYASFFSLICSRLYCLSSMIFFICSNSLCFSSLYSSTST